MKFKKGDLIWDDDASNLGDYYSGEYVVNAREGVVVNLADEGPMSPWTIELEHYTYSFWTDIFREPIRKRSKRVKCI